MNLRFFSFKKLLRHNFINDININYCQFDIDFKTSLC